MLVISNKAVISLTRQQIYRYTENEVLRMNQEGLVISQGGWVGFVVG
jgi:hypothetical protein